MWGSCPRTPPPGLGMPLTPTPCDGGKEGSQAPIAVEGSAGPATGTTPWLISLS